MASTLVTWFRREPETLAAMKRKLVSAGYPHLHLVEIEDRIEARGTVSLAADDRELTRFAIRVILPDDYPKSLPKVFETANRIPRTPEFHVESDGALCVGLPEDVWLEYEQIDLIAFLDGPVRSYLIGVYEVEHGRPWPFGEWGHGEEGVEEFHRKHLGVVDRDVIVHLLRAACRPQLTWRVPCPCRSGQLMHTCHGEQLRALKRRVPRSVLKRSAATLAMKIGGAPRRGLVPSPRRRP